MAYYSTVNLLLLIYYVAVASGFSASKYPICHQRQHAIIKENGFFPLPIRSTLPFVPSAGATSPFTEPSKSLQQLHEIIAFVQRNFLLIGMAIGVSLAKAFPSLGAAGTVPEAIISKYGVFLVFLLSGLSIELKDLKDAAFRFRLNFLIQGLSFLAWPCLIGLPTIMSFKRFLPGVLRDPVLDGILIMTCLPTTVNMCVFLTGAADGNIASALCNSVIGNFLGMFITPALLLQFFGTSIEFPFRVMVTKLCSKVLLPVAAGQLLRFTKAKDLYKTNSKFFKMISEVILCWVSEVMFAVIIVTNSNPAYTYIIFAHSIQLSLIGIAWTAFCNAFSNGIGDLGPANVISLVAILMILHLFSIWGIFNIFKIDRLGFTREEVVAGTFTASHKTMAFGLPLIKIIFDGNRNVASYLAPVMLIHPIQLFLGSLIVQFFKSYTAQSWKAKS